MDCFLGEIKLFAGDYAPQDWALCDGKTLPIEDNQALFSLLGTTYGGDGVTTFALPDLRGRTPVGVAMEAEAGLTSRTLGQSFGNEQHTLTVAEMASHNHPVYANPDTATMTSSANSFAGTSSNFTLYAPTSTTSNPPPTMSATAVTSVGGNQPHDNMMPTTCINFIIALVGYQPTRN